MTPPQNVNVLVGGFNRLFTVLQIRITEFNVGVLPDHHYDIMFETKRGSYGLPGVVWPHPMNRGFRLYNSFLKEHINFHSFIYAVMPSIIYNIANNGDTDSVETLFIALCKFWDSFYIQLRKGVLTRAVSGLAELDAYIYNDPANQMNPKKSFSIHAKEFRSLVSSPLGWKMYETGRLGNRKEIQDVLNGKMF